MVRMGIAYFAAQVIDRQSIAGMAMKQKQRSPRNAATGSNLRKMR
jgi:hypothetical protein